MEDESGRQDLGSSSKTFSEWSDEMCAYYMAIGVPYAEYWHGDYTQLQHYAKAQEFRIEQRNQEMWLQGLYNYEAFKSVINAFSWGLNGRKGTKPSAYRGYPISITKREKEVEKQRAVAKTLAWIESGQVE